MTKVLTITCLLLSGFFIIAFIIITSMTLHYPFHLEWMEGQTIDVIQRVADGKSLYVEPSLEYVPFIYTPFYYYAAAFVAWFTGVDFFPARLLSFVSALGCGALIWAWIRKEGGHWTHAAIAAGIFFATYPLSGRWFDIARVDSLFLFLTLLGLFLYFHYSRFAILTGLVMALAFFTKQAALLVVLPVLIAGIFIDLKQALITSVTLASALLFGIAILDWGSEGWFHFYAFEIPVGHPPAKEIWPQFWGREMLGALGGLCVLALLALWLYRYGPKRGVLYLMLALGFVGGSFIMRLHSYSYLNVLMPAHVALALLAGLALRLDKPWVLLVALAQMATLVYDPTKFLPSPNAIDIGNRFLKDIAQIEGDIFMPEFQFVQTRAGKKSYAFGMAAFDLFRADLKDKNDIKDKLQGELKRAILERRFAAIMPGRLFILPEKRWRYAFKQHIPYPGELVTGAIDFTRTDIYLRTSEIDTQRPDVIQVTPKRKKP